MPQDLTNGQNAGKKSFSLNLDALGDAANQTVNMGSGEKPVLTQPTVAVVTGTDFRLMNDLRANQNDPAVKYLNTIFAVETKFKYLNDAGEEVEGTSRDNYGGLRFYPELDEQGNPITDATGQPKLKRLWSSDNSAFGRLFKLAQTKDGNIRSYADFFRFIKEGLNVSLLSETTNYQGNTHKKNVIKEIL